MEKGKPRPTIKQRPKMKATKKLGGFATKQDKLNAANRPAPENGAQFAFPDREDSIAVIPSTPPVPIPRQCEELVVISSALSEEKTRHESGKHEESKNAEQEEPGPSNLLKNDPPEGENQLQEESKNRAQEKSGCPRQVKEDPSICALCEDGGNLLSCDGKCGRDFHARKIDVIGGADCQTLDLSGKKWAELKKIKFICENCKYEIHQCFVCGELGSSEQQRQEVFMCQYQSCAKFYHLNCLTELGSINGGTASPKHVLPRTAKFVCPRHKCDTCKKEASAPDKLIRCLRCPKAWHTKCFKNFRKSGELPKTKIWNLDGLQCIYCRKHRIVKGLQTPVRDHVKFPSLAMKKI